MTDTRGRASARYLGKGGAVGHSIASEWEFIYGTSLVKDPEWEVGDRVVLADGRVFRYCRSDGACYTGQLNKFQSVIGTTSGIDYSALAEAAAIGDTSILMTNQGVIAQTENCMRGGWIEIKVANTDASGNQEGMQRMIIGNTADASATMDGTVRIYLDAPLTAAVTTSSYAFSIGNPWNAVSNDATATNSCCGVAATYVSASGYYHWEQTWGLCFITDIAATLGKVNAERQLIANATGGVAPHDSGCTEQHVGFIVDDNASANGMSLVMLQISP